VEQRLSSGELTHDQEVVPLPFISNSPKTITTFLPIMNMLRLNPKSSIPSLYPFSLRVHKFRTSMKLGFATLVRKQGSKKMEKSTNRASERERERESDSKLRERQVEHITSHNLQSIAAQLHQTPLDPHEVAVPTHENRHGKEIG
jgi:hypothetical protein